MKDREESYVAEKSIYKYRFTDFLGQRHTIYDTAKKLELLNPEEPTSHIGIRILNQIAQDTEYYTTMNIYKE